MYAALHPMLVRPTRASFAPLVLHFPSPASLFSSDLDRSASEKDSDIIHAFRRTATDLRHKMKEVTLRMYD